MRRAHKQNWIQCDMNKFQVSDAQGGFQGLFNVSRYWFFITESDFKTVCIFVKEIEEKVQTYVKYFGAMIGRFCTWRYKIINVQICSIFRWLMQTKCVHILLEYTKLF